MPDDFLIRPMREDDAEVAEEVTREAFHDLDLRRRRADEPPPEPRSPARRGEWCARVRFLLGTDPGGCWVAERGGRVLGVAVSVRRDLTWILVTYAVRPGHQGRGIGRTLLEAALTRSTGCLRGMISASPDPLAARRYARAGFTLHPMMFLAGPVPRSVLPVVEHVRDGSPGDVDLCDSIDRRVREAAHGVDHELMRSQHRLLVTDRPSGSGYVYLEADGSPYLLAATNRRTATALLWEALAATDPARTAHIGHVTAEQGWAVDTGLEAGMRLDTAGYLALRGMKPPAPYLPSGHFL
ncbi:MAG: GNAT family N-acetyltransferase [Nocardioidaceae bacterium]